MPARFGKDVEPHSISRGSLIRSRLLSQTETDHDNMARSDNSTHLPTYAEVALLCGASVLNDARPMPKPLNNGENIRGTLLPKYRGAVSAISGRLSSSPSPSRCNEVTKQKTGLARRLRGKSHGGKVNRPVSQTYGTQSEDEYHARL